MHKSPGAAWDVLIDIGRMSLTRRPHESSGPANQQDSMRELALTVPADKGAD